MFRVGESNKTEIDARAKCIWHNPTACSVSNASVILEKLNCLLHQLDMAQVDFFHGSVVADLVNQTLELVEA